MPSNTNTKPVINDFAACHTGVVRSHNEDAVLSLSEQGLWAVADGMGGPGVGDIAATLVMEAVQAGIPPLGRALAALEGEASSESRVRRAGKSLSSSGGLDGRARGGRSDSSRLIADGIRTEEADTLSSTICHFLRF